MKKVKLLLRAWFSVGRMYGWHIRTPLVGIGHLRIPDSGIRDYWWIGLVPNVTLKSGGYIYLINKTF